MSDHSLFDYDSRPVTPQLVLIDTAVSPVAYAIRDFLSRNGASYEWVDAGDSQRVAALVGPAEVDASQLPLCILPNGELIHRATVEAVAGGLGMMAQPALSEYDLAVVGAGPAGLAAAVYGASEGLRTIAIEALAPGGQAGTTSMIENYLGFPNGISGSELATRASAQARRFGAEILVARRLTGIGADGSGYIAELSDDTRIAARALLYATGVEWRRLDAPGIDDLLGAGVYYGAGPSEALACTQANVAIVGGGNSAGQAVVRFSNYARRVTLLVRGDDLGRSMSQYLIDRITELDNVDVRLGSHVTGFDADGRLRAVVINDTERLTLDSLFICIGGTPRTEAVASLGLRTDDAGYLLTGGDLTDLDGDWPLSREPMPLETNRPGVFAAGDVRSGSIKRCSGAIGEGAMAVALVHRRLAEAGGD